MHISALLLACIAPILQCDALGKRQSLDVEMFEQQWPGNCESETLPVTQERYEALRKQVCEMRLELVRVDERSKSSQEKLDLEKAHCEKDIQTLKAHTLAEKSWTKQICDLRVQLAAQNISSALDLHLKLQQCQVGLNYAEQRSRTCKEGFHSSNVEDFSSVLTPSVGLLNLSTGYYYFSTESERQNWHLAGKHCKSLGLELASVETQKENDELLQTIGSNRDSFWLSGTDLGSEGTFHWAATGKPLEPYTFWLPDNPNNHGGNQNCVQFHQHRPSGEGLYWNDANCSERCRFICELAAHHGQQTDI